MAATETAGWRALLLGRGNAMLKWLGPSLLFGAALAQGAQAQGSTAFDGQYMGQLKLTKVISGDCTEPPPGALFPLVVSDGQVQFKYVPRFDTILSGRIDENGNFSASRHVRKGLVSMTGHIEDTDVTAYITSPSCKYTFRSD
jgi:hypothetical protein